MNIAEAIWYIDSNHICDKYSNDWEAWQVLKAAVLAQHTTNAPNMQVEPNCLKCRCHGHCSVSLKSDYCYHMFRFNQHT